MPVYHSLLINRGGKTLIYTQDDLKGFYLIIGFYLATLRLAYPYKYTAHFQYISVDI